MTAINLIFDSSEWRKVCEVCTQESHSIWGLPSFQSNDRSVQLARVYEVTFAFGIIEEGGVCVCV